MTHVLRPIRRLLTAACLAVLTVPAGCAARPTAAVAARPVLISDLPPEDCGAAGMGRIIEAPAEIERFAPDETSRAVDASSVSLKQVFEDLGPDATEWYQHVQTLADPFFEGREPGTRGADLAAGYIEFYFTRYGLEPAFGAEGYRQPFTYTRRDVMPTVDVLTAELSINGHSLQDGVDFAALGNSGSGRITAPLTFAGYGIASGPDGYTSFLEDTDMTGRVAIVLRYAPLDESGESLWDEQQRRRHASVSRKLRNVAKRGAAAILLVNPPGAAEAPEGLESIDDSRRFGASLEVPAFQVTTLVADKLMRQADPSGRGLMEWRRLADRGEIGTEDLSDTLQVTAAAEVTRQRATHDMTGQNVGAILRGSGAISDEWIVICAHYDHVGIGTHGGISPANRGKLHPGADDNASGTAGVLVLARALAQEYERQPLREARRSILFLAFDGEEMGLKGSAWLAEHSPVPPQQMSLVLNMDMIGRLRAGTLSVLGVETGEGLPEILLPLFEASGLTIAVNGGGSGRSDDASFHRAKVPALHFFTGMHQEYTTPQDQAYTVNPAGAAEVLSLIQNITMALATRPQILVYQTPPAGAGENRGYGRVRLGIRPSMDDDLEHGVAVEGVSEGTPADEAGILPGDIIVAWDGERIEGLGDIAEHLQQHDPGDRVKITVLRDGQSVELDVTLKAGGG